MMLIGTVIKLRRQKERLFARWPSIRRALFIGFVQVGFVLLPKIACAATSTDNIFEFAHDLFSSSLAKAVCLILFLGGMLLALTGHKLIGVVGACLGMSALLHFMPDIVDLFFAGNTDYS
ncbi:MAG: hypothetical protein K0R24_1614 [Gammaproteobacteria bacterium]|nr:hypothetical protein [Gammaproteobacteria bacterium]